MPDVDLDLDRLEARLAQGDLALPVLTDEELAALGDLGRRPIIVPMGAWFDGLAEDARTAAVQAAARSLTARGLARAVPGAPGELDLSPPLLTILGLRRHFVSIAQLDTTVGGTTTSRWWYRAAEDVVLEEVVEGSGFHRFTARNEARAVLDLVGLIDPDGVAGTDSEPIEREGADAPEAWSDVEAHLAAASRTTAVFAAHRVGEDRIVHTNATFATDTEGVWVVSGIEAEGAPRRLSARTLSPTGVGVTLLSCLRPPE